ncbi:hypothetical protein DPMN_149352 [Dreissena polymorpha]|uniref:Uncharacterized protein n=1 Tax=Dreissena polymorpha TaxID=45954 RepID=A0A9D4FFP8_DREPO|nr:hypothetical protein DPMN_149352 [Dreissena polymorpha]
MSFSCDTFSDTDRYGQDLALSMNMTLPDTNRTMGSTIRRTSCIDNDRACTLCFTDCCRRRSNAVYKRRQRLQWPIKKNIPSENNEIIEQEHLLLDTNNRTQNRYKVQE